MAFVYNKASGLNDARFGKIETPIRMIIEHESDLLKKKGGPVDWLFNVETSNRFGETIIGGNEFDTFKATTEGGRAENDATRDTFKKFIEHIQFMKSFTITAEMMEDANYGVAADAKLRAQNFTRAYYKTRHQIASAILAEAAAKKASTTFAGASIDITGPNAELLFSASHKVGADGDTQSNIYTKSGALADKDAIAETLAAAAVDFRNMKDENGDPLGYTADTIILPGNVASLEKNVKEVLGTEQASGNGSYINTQYGNWNLVVLPNWQVADPSSFKKLILMSKDANEALRGNMFFNRVPLTIDSGKDPFTSNFFWVGRCRFGVGFGSYKHIMLVEG
jgi:hypothetical protein